MICFTLLLLNKKKTIGDILQIGKAKHLWQKWETKINYFNFSLKDVKFTTTPIELY